MLIKAIVFNGDDSIYYGFRYFFIIDRASIFFGTKLSDRLAITEICKASNFIVVDFLFYIGTRTYRIVLDDRRDIAENGASSEQDSGKTEQNKPAKCRPDPASFSFLWNLLSVLSRFFAPGHSLIISGVVLVLMNHSLSSFMTATL
ncbi:hypothetical protein D3C73_1089000 [compost metagenome]